MVAVVQAPKKPKHDPSREYIAGPSLVPSLRVLPSTSDDVLRDLGYAVYDKMMHDPKVAGSVFLLIDSVLADGITLSPAIVGTDGQADKEADDVKQFCERALSQLQRPLRQTLAMMLKAALKYGYCIAEQTYKDGAGEDAGNYVFHSIKVKTRRSVAFVVDPQMNIEGFAAVKVTDKGFATTPFSVLGKPEDLIEREKCVVLTLNAEDEDPRGKSSLRPSYNAWNLKTLVWPEFLLWLMNCAVPGLILFLPENAADEPQRDDAGNIVSDSQGNAIQIDPAAAGVATLQRFRNAFAAVFPNGASVTQIESKSEGDAFKNSVDLLNVEIAEGILFQASATSERRFGTRSESDQKMTVMDLLVFWVKGVAEDMLSSDVLKPFVRANFGDDKAEKLTPKPSLGDTERRNFEKTLTAYANAYDKRFIKESQLAPIHAELGLTPASEEPAQPNQTAQDQGANQPPQGAAA